jgi:hypothetical protein
MTPEGEALIADLFPRFNAEESFVVSWLTQQEQNCLASALRSIHGLLDAEGEARREAMRTARQRPAGLDGLPVAHDR